MFIGLVPTFGGLIPSFLCVTYPFQLVQSIQLPGHPSFFGQVTIFTSETKPLFLASAEMVRGKPHLSPPNMVGLSPSRGSWGGKGITGFGGGKGYDEGSTWAAALRFFPVLFGDGEFTQRKLVKTRINIHSITSNRWLYNQ